VPDLTGNEKKYLNECIDSGWISSEGPFVEKFENEFAAKVNRKYAIAVSSGTAALDVAIEALGIGPGDEVIVPTFTIISCLLQISRSGAVPIPIDSDPVTWCMDVSKIKERITKKTKAILMVHIYGLPVDIDPVLELAKKFKLRVIEDAAEAHGLMYKGRPCGSFGDISIFSFYPNKLITTGEGGMVLTNRLSLANACRSLRNLCFQAEKRFVHERLGWNYRMTNIQAAIGLAQLERFNQFVGKKRELGKRYQELLKDEDKIQLPQPSTSYSENIYWVFGVTIKDELKETANGLMRRLEKVGVATRPFFYPMHMQPILLRMKIFKKMSLPVSERLYKKGFYLPSGLGMDLGDIDIVASRLKPLLKKIA
jgi:perosamine synthetase